MSKPIALLLAVLCLLSVARHAGAQTPAVTVSLPQTLQEGRSVEVLVGRWPAGDTPLTVDLISSDASQLVVPASVTIPAQMTGAVITITASDNSVVDGSRSVTVTPSIQGVAGTAGSVTIRDDEVVSYRMSPVTDVMSIPVPMRVTACDIEGNVVDYSGEVKVTAQRANGESVPVQPSSIQLGGPFGGFAPLQVPVASNGLRLRVSDRQGRSVESPLFYPLRTIPLPSADLVFDQRRNCFYASVPASASSVYAGKVVRIDAATLEMSAGSVLQDPGPLALTSDGSGLYVGLNGNASVARLDPATLELQSTFAVGADPAYGTLMADELTTVPGCPNQVIVSRRIVTQKQNTGGVALYLNGKALPAQLVNFNFGRMRVERSADPSIFFVWGPYGLSWVKRDANGLTQVAFDDRLFPAGTTDIVSSGDTVVSDTGVGVDGTTMRPLGSVALQLYQHLGPVRLDAAHQRLYFLEHVNNTFAPIYNGIGVYDPASYQLVRRFTAPSITAEGTLLRWGAHGLAFRSANSISLINSTHIVPDLARADVSVSVMTNPGSPAVGAPIVYSVTVANHGPESARGVFVRATVSNTETAPAINASPAHLQLSPGSASAAIGDLPPNTQVQFTVTTTAPSAGLAWCSVTADSSSLDPSLADNTGIKLVNAGYALAADSVQGMHFPASNLIYDSSRNLLWTTLSDPAAAPLMAAIVGIDPATGELSEPIPLARAAVPNSIAISPNGRYLYVGLTETPAVQRVDIGANPYTSVMIPLAQDYSGDEARDIAVLGGDGTSFAATRRSGGPAVIYDGDVPRRNVPFNNYTISRIEKTSTPGLFVGYNGNNSGFQTMKLQATKSGLSVTQTVRGLINYNITDLRASGDIALSANGIVFNTTDLTFKLNLGKFGRPCLDAPQHCAYLVNGPQIYGFDSGTGLPIGTLPLPIVPESYGLGVGDWAISCVRWGTDGLAVIGYDNLYIARWSAAVGHP